MKAASYRRLPAGTQPNYLYPPYISTCKRSPKLPLILLPHTLSELTGPVFGHSDIGENDDDLTRQHSGEPIGERIIVSGRVLDEDGRAIPGALVEVWQTNAAGRYRHRVDQHGAPLDPNFTGCGRVLTDSRRPLSFCHHKTRRLPLAKSSECLAPGAHSLFAFRRGAALAPGHANVFSRRSSAAVRSRFE